MNNGIDKEKGERRIVPFKLKFASGKMQLMVSFHSGVLTEPLGSSTVVIPDVENHELTPWYIKDVMQHPQLRTYLFDQLLYNMLNAE